MANQINPDSGNNKHYLNQNKKIVITLPKQKENPVWKIKNRRCII